MKALKEVVHLRIVEFINTFKVYYCQHWTRYLLQEFEEG
jgi:hypothetical protein